MMQWAGRLVTTVMGCIAAITVAVFGLATVAAAHVEVEAEPAVAGATNATVTFSAEAESPTAGISSVRIVLPEGIVLADVTLKTAPAGWTLTPTADGYTVGGKALKVHAEAVHSVLIARLPDETRLVFKALVTYSNGDVDRWIEEPTSANPEPEDEAPVLQLAAGPARTTLPPVAAPPTPSPATPASVADPVDEDGTTWPWWLLGVVVVAGAAAGTVAILRRRSTPQ